MLLARSCRVGRCLRLVISGSLELRASWHSLGSLEPLIFKVPRPSNFGYLVETLNLHKPFPRAPKHLLRRYFGVFLGGLVPSQVFGGLGFHQKTTSEQEPLVGGCLTHRLRCMQA